MSTEADATARLWTADTRPFIVSVLALMTVIAFESLAVTTVLPVVVVDLGGARWYSLAFAATIATALVGTIVGGGWADRYGTTRPLVVGGALFVLGIAACVLAPNPGVFVAGRLLQGLGGGIDAVVLYVLIARHIPAPARASMFGLLTTAWLLPSIVGPLVAGALTEWVGWRVVFTIVLVAAVCSLGTLLSVVRHDPAPEQPTGTAVLGRRGVLAVVAAATTLVLHVGATRAPPISVVVVAVGLVVAALVAGRLLPAGTLRLRGTAPTLVALRAVFGATVTGTDVYLTLYLQQERGASPTIAGVVVAVGAAGWATGAWLQGRRTGNDRTVIATAAPLVLAGPVVVLLHTLHLVPLTATAVACVLMGAGMGMAYPRISSGTLAAADPREHGSYSSALQAGESMAAAVLLGVTGAVLVGVAGAPGFVAVYALLVGLGSAAAVIAARQLGRTSSTTNPPVQCP